MAGTPIPSSDEASYVKMADVDSRPDASLIGAHCQLEYCNQLDFLPFHCQSCRKTFCLDHRSESAHKCTNAGAWAERKRRADLARPAAGQGKVLRDAVSQGPCSRPGCKTIIGTGLVPGVHCESCNRNYCLSHRLRDEHDCAKLEPIGARPGGNDAAARAMSALGKLRAWGAAKKEQAGRAMPKPKPSTAAQRMVAVSNLKKTAKGDEKLAPEKRIYLFVEAEADSIKSKVPKGQFFYSRDWVVGKLLDSAARSLQVQNINNASEKEEDKLRVFHVEGGRLLEFNEKVGATLVSGNTIVLLRGAGPPPSLMEL